MTPSWLQEVPKIIALEPGISVDLFPHKTVVVGHSRSMNDYSITSELEK